MTLRAGITILVVDDELHVVESLKRTLRHEQYEVLTYTSPLEAMARLDEGGIDILLSDIDMPEMTGLVVSMVNVFVPDNAQLLELSQAWHAQEWVPSGIPALRNELEFISPVTSAVPFGVPLRFQMKVIFLRTVLKLVLTALQLKAMLAEFVICPSSG